MATASASLDFDGTADYVDFGDVSIFDGLTAVSSVIWINYTALPVSPNTDSIVRKDGTYTPFQYNNSSNEWKSVYWDPSIKVLTIIDTPATATWLHMGSVWAAGDNSGKTTFYEDGVSLGDTSTGATGTITSGGSVTMRIGATESGGEAYDGFAAYCIQFSKKLSIDEVNELMWNPYSIAGAISSWSLTDGGSTQYDKSTNSNDGTVTGATVSTDGPPVFLLGGQ